MDKCDGTTSTLHISQKNLDCQKVTDTLVRCGVCSHVTPNSTVQYDPVTKRHQRENGCSIVICELNKKYIKDDVWAPLKTEFGLTCAYLDVAGHYQGCVLKLPDDMV